MVRSCRCSCPPHSGQATVTNFEFLYVSIDAVTVGNPTQFRGYGRGYASTSANDQRGLILSDTRKSGLPFWARIPEIRAPILRPRSPPAEEIGRASGRESDADGGRAT